jgi:hypothetical protein
MAERKKLRVLEWPCQSQDINPVEMLWTDMKAWAVLQYTKVFRNTEGIKYVKNRTLNFFPTSYEKVSYYVDMCFEAGYIIKSSPK